MTIPKKVKEVLEKQQYRIVGNHSAVKICRWTRKSLTEGKVCYKEKWYPPVKSHRCMQMSPSLFCDHNCFFCWRLQPGDRGLNWKESFERIDEPREILEGCIEARKKLLSGFKGNEEVDRKKWDEAIKPSMIAISLTGEPTIYPRLSELIEESKKMGMTTFLVTNGTFPEKLESLDEKPFQLYVTLPAPDEETYKKTCRPSIKDGWERINKTLELFPSFNCRKVIRLTLVKGLNMIKPEEYSRLIEKADPDFLEIKSYMWVGESQKRLSIENMPLMDDIRDFSKNISCITDYNIKGESIPSRVVLLSKE